MGARRQPLTIAITTAGYDRNSICFKSGNTPARSAMASSTTRHFLPVIYEAPEGADWTDESVWHAANPALGDFRSLDEMRELFREPSTCRLAKMFPPTVPKPVDESAVRWIGTEAWDACAQGFDLAALDGASVSPGSTWHTEAITPRWCSVFRSTATTT